MTTVPADRRSAGTDLWIQAAGLTAGGNVGLSSGGTLSLLSVTDSSYASYTSSKSNAVWQSMSDKGHSDTTVRMTEITSGRGLRQPLQAGPHVEGFIVRDCSPPSHQKWWVV